MPLHACDDERLGNTWERVLNVERCSSAKARAHARTALIWYRSEEHTSELQSHPVISYAVFCLKKVNMRWRFLPSARDYRMRILKISPMKILEIPPTYHKIYQTGQLHG